MSHGTEFLVEPCESVTFGPPKSHSAGESHRVFSLFPPPPMAFQGMVRTRLLYGAQPELDLDSGRDRETIAGLVGKPEALPKGWQLQGPFPARRLPPEAEDERGIVQPWLPAPRFLLNCGGNVLHAREVRSTHPGLCDLGDFKGVPLLGRPGLKKAEPLGGWIGPANLRYALSGEGCANWERRQWASTYPPFVTSEFQPGLAIDNANASARHGMLYFNQALRFAAGSGFYGRLHAALPAELDAAALTQGAVLAGRKGRLAAFCPVGKLDPDWAHILAGEHLPKAVPDGARFWLLAITPARIEEDVRHPKLDARIPAGVRVEPRAALTGRAVTLGGYDMVARAPRANRLYVPAGSAWLIEVRGGSDATRREALLAMHNRHPLGHRDDAAFGFGHTLVGLGPRTTEEGP